jgi:hypothetical protein
MTALTWTLIAVGLVTVSVCAAQVHRRRVSSPGVALALPIAGVLALPALLVDDAPATAWGLWGTTTVAAATTPLSQSEQVPPYPSWRASASPATAVVPATCCPCGFQLCSERRA